MGMRVTVVFIALLVHVPLLGVTALQRHFGLLWKFPNSPIDSPEGNPRSLIQSPRNPDPLQSNGNYLYFRGDDAYIGEELWGSGGDGSNTGIQQDVYPGSQASTIKALTATDATHLTQCVFFTANDGTHGEEPHVAFGPPLLVSFMVNDIMPGSDSSSPRGYANHAGLTYFSAQHPTFGDELHSIACGLNTVTFVADICPGACQSNITEITSCGGRLYMSAKDGIHGQELVMIIGAAITVIDIWPGAQSSNPTNLICRGTKIYFAAAEPSVGRALLSHDGASLVIEADPNPNINNYGAERMSVIELGGEELLLFSGHNESLGWEPHVLRTAPGDWGFLHDINAGKASSKPSEMHGHVKFEDMAIFAATAAENGGRELWATKGLETLPVPAPAPRPNSTEICEVLFAFDVSQPCDAVYNPGTDPACEIPLTETIVSNTTTIVLQNISVIVNRTFYYPNGTDYLKEVEEFIAYNETFVEMNVTTVDLNSYPCIFNRELKGSSGKDYEFPQGLTSTWLYCDLSNSSSKPRDMHVIPGSPEHMLMRARDADEIYRLYVAVAGNGTGPPNQNGTNQNFDIAQQIGHCEQVVDINGFDVQEIQKPVTLESTGVTYFFAKTSDGIEGLWYVDAKATPTPPETTCTTPGHVPNVCGKCAALGDQRSCKGLTCSPTLVYNACGRCVWPDSDYQGEKCICQYDATYLPSQPGFGVYAFNDMTTAITHCSTGDIWMYNAGVIAAPLTVTTDGLCIRTAPSNLPTLTTLAGYLNIDAGINGLTFENLGLFPGPGACSSNSNTIVRGNLLSGTLNLTNIFIQPSGCTFAFGMTLGGDAYIKGNTVLSGVSFGITYDFVFSPCGAGIPIPHHINFTENVGSNVLGGWLRASQITSSWILDNECTNCGGSLNVFDVRGCIHYQPAWFEIGRNVITTTTNAGGNGAMIRMHSTRVHNVYGNIADGGLANCILTENVALDANPTRGLPPPATAWVYVIDDVPIGAARHLAYMNERCQGHGVDVDWNSLGLCEALCGMDEVANLGMLREQKDLVVVPPWLNFTQVFSVMHLENRYVHLRYNSTILQNYTLNQISPGLTGIVPDYYDTPCNVEILDRQSRCRQEFPTRIPVTNDTKEVVGDYSVLFDAWINNRFRLNFDSNLIQVWWFIDDSYRTRIYGSQAAMYLDSDLLMPVNKDVDVILEGQRVYLSVGITDIQPQLPDDFTDNFEIEIDQVIMCFPNASFWRGLQPSTIIALPWDTGPVPQYRPDDPFRTGCNAKNLGMRGPYTIYSRTELNGTKYYDQFNPTVYRNVGQPISQHNIAFDMVVTEEVPVEIEASITIVYNILWKKFIRRVEYQWETGWQNISFVNQIDFRRDCPSPDDEKTDGDGDGLYTCTVAPEPPEPVEPFPWVYVIFGSAGFLVAMALLFCIFRCLSTTRGAQIIEEKDE